MTCGGASCACAHCRDVMKFEFDKIRTLNVSNRFEIRRLFKHLVIECKFMEKFLLHDWFHIVCVDSQRAQTNFFQIQSITQLQLLNLQHNFCSVMCYIGLIWTSILFTLGNSIVTLLLNWPKPVHYIPTDEMNASIRRIAFAEFWKSRFAFDICEFWPLSSHHWHCANWIIWPCVHLLLVEEYKIPILFTKNHIHKNTPEHDI